MNKADTKRLAETVSTAGSMVLFLIFTVCSLVIITAAASAYRRITDNYDDTFSSAAAVRYTANKLRACNAAELLADGVVLENFGYKTVIYARGGVLYESLFADGTEARAEGGEAVFRAEGFSVTDCGNGIAAISANAANGGVFTVYCKLPDGGEDVG